MLTLAYFPPLWRKVMDHRVLEHYSGDISRVNVHPRRRDVLVARHSATANADQGRTIDFEEKA